MSKKNSNSAGSGAGGDNMFDDILNNASAAEEKYLGPDYPYYKYVRTPEQMGMSSKGTLTQLGKDIDGLKNYVQLLVQGNGKASATGKPLGNKFFLKTGAKCESTVDGSTQDRYIYVNNVPTGNIPFISSGLGVNFKEFKGLIPGTLSDLNGFNPLLIMQGFMEGAKPKCDLLTMEVIDVNNNKSTETHYVTRTDIKNIEPCTFKNRKNPITKAACKETFAVAAAAAGGGASTAAFSDDNCVNNLFYLSFGIFGIYVLHKLV